MSVRTDTINALRGTLYEFGVTLARGKHAGLKALATHRAEIDAKMPEPIQRLVDGQLAMLKEIGRRIDELEAEIGVQQEQLEEAAKLREVPGIGLLGATALAATLGDGSAWKSGREFSANRRRSCALRARSEPAWLAHRRGRTRPSQCVLEQFAARRHPPWALFGTARTMRSTGVTIHPEPSETTLILGRSVL